MESFRIPRSPVSQALVVWGGWEGHQPQAVAHIIASQLAAYRVSAHISDDIAELDQIDLKEYDLIVPVWSFGIQRPQTMNRVLEAVRAGTGLATFHGGIDWFADREYAHLIGGHFIFHPPETEKYRVCFEPVLHPITEGLKDFEIQTEQYYLHVDPANTVLATTRFGDTATHSGAVIMPSTWIKTYGQGRICYCSLAHTPDEIQQWPVISLLMRGMKWAARG